MDPSLAYLKHYSRYENPPFFANLYFSTESNLNKRFISYCEREKSLMKRLIMAAGKQFTNFALGAICTPGAIAQVPIDFVIDDFCPYREGDTQRNTGLRRQASLIDDLSKKRISFFERIKFDLHAAKYFWTQSYKTWKVAINPEKARPNFQAVQV